MQIDRCPAQSLETSRATLLPVRKALCYLIYALWIERNMPSNVRDSRERFLVGRHRVDGFLSSDGNAEVVAIAFVRAEGDPIRLLQL